MKYCDTCIYFVKRTLGCKLFGVRSGVGKKAMNFPVEYVRAVPMKMCGPEGTYHMTHEEKHAMDLRAKANIDYDAYFGFEEKDYINFDAHRDFDRDMEVEKVLKPKRSKK